tara:strand:+ start:3981 stop:4484 length:504 start_codon:yes stop_codon:yes gene_type:complete
MNKAKGFTLIELIIVIVILGILAVTATPKLLGISADAKIGALNGLSASIKATVKTVEMKAVLKGLKKTSVNPEGRQEDYIIDFGFAKTEVYYGNLCPESSSELNQEVSFFEFMNLSVGDDIITEVDNQYAAIGYEIPADRSVVKGCYVLYDSFAEPNCTVTVVDVDC